MVKFFRRVLATPATAVHWLGLTVFVTFEKLVIYIIDSNPQVFLGDSMSYLATAMQGYIPHDRSFVYGYALYALTSRARSLSSLVAAQTLAGILTALLVAVILVRFFRAPFVIAAVAAALLALEPQQLLFERFVMTESFSTMLFAAFLFLALEYIQKRRIWALVLLHVVGILMISFRAAYVPIVMAATVLAPILASLSAGSLWIGLDWNARARALKWAGLRLGASLLLMYGLHGAYKDLNGRLMKYPPAYTYADGFFLLANVSPLVSPADTDDPRVAAVLAQPLAYVSSSDRIGSRNAETFLEQGLVVRLQAALKDFYSANAEAKRVALRAIRRDPMGFLSLAFETYRLFFSETTMVAIVSAESGVREFAPEEERILNHYHLDARGLPFMKTVTRQYYMASWRYYWLLTPAPFALLACVPFARKEWKRPLWFLFLACGLHAGIVQVMGVVPSPRHLHSMAVVLAVAIGVAATRLWAAPAEPEESLPTSARAGASGR